MATQKELEELLTRLADAGKEAKATLSELHGERKALMELRKAIRSEISEAVKRGVEAEMNVVAAQARSDMGALMVDVIGKLEHDWREKLGLL